MAINNEFKKLILKFTNIIIFTTINISDIGFDNILLGQKSDDNISIMMLSTKLCVVQSLYAFFWIKQMDILEKMMELNI